jgi:predicted NAD-dependent protein-ADP-ribosyltransferase YbiA (DUF1768 family)
MPKTTRPRNRLKQESPRPSPTGIRHPRERYRAILSILGRRPIKEEDGAEGQEPEERKTLALLYGDVERGPEKEKSAGRDCGVKRRPVHSIAPPENNFLSPFYVCPFAISTCVYRSVIHYVLARRFLGDAAMWRAIMTLEDPHEALALVHRHDAEEKAAESLVVSMAARKTRERSEAALDFALATHCKFDQNPALRDALLATEEHPIIEASTHRYWGGLRSRGGGGGGGDAMARPHNMGGKVLNNVRAALRHRPRH